MSTQAIWGIARADFRERTRRYSFLVTLLFAVFVVRGLAEDATSASSGATVAATSGGWM